MREADLVGQDILVGLTYHDKVRGATHGDQFHGRLVEIQESSYLIERFDRPKETWIPRDFEAIRPAPSGSYRLATSGLVVEDSTWVTSWLYDVLEDEEGGTYYEVEPNYAAIGRDSRAKGEWEFTYRYDEGAIRRVLELLADDYLGKSILLGVTHTHWGQFVRQEQIVGTIARANWDEGVVIDDESGRFAFRLPPDLAMIDRGQKAEYRLRSDGRVITNPDFVASVTIDRESE